MTKRSEARPDEHSAATAGPSRCAEEADCGQWPRPQRSGVECASALRVRNSWSRVGSSFAIPAVHCVCSCVLTVIGCLPAAALRAAALAGDARLSPLIGCCLCLGDAASGADEHADSSACKPGEAAWRFCIVAGAADWL